MKPKRCAWRESPDSSRCGEPATKTADGEWACDPHAEWLRSEGAFVVDGEAARLSRFEYDVLTVFEAIPSRERWWGEAQARCGPEAVSCLGQRRFIEKTPFVRYRPAGWDDEQTTYQWTRRGANAYAAAVRNATFGDPDAQRDSDPALSVDVAGPGLFSVVEREGGRAFALGWVSAPGIPVRVARGEIRLAVHYERRRDSEAWSFRAALARIEQFGYAPATPPASARARSSAA